MRSPPFSSRAVLPCAIAAIAIVAACGGDTSRVARDSDSATDARCTQGAPLTVTSRGVGPMTLGLRVSALRARCELRDTTWDAEGMRETGVLLDVGEATLLGVTTGTSDTSISRIVVDDDAPRTALGTGVGSSVADLRRKHGRVCGAVGEGIVVAHVPGAPGIAFALTVPSGALPAGGLEIEAHPEMIPDSAHVASLWVHEGQVGCGTGEVRSGRDPGAQG